MNSRFSLKLLALGLNLLVATGLRAQSRQVVAHAGIDRGGLVLGANFDIADTATESYGAYARLYSKDRDEGAPAIFALGASFRGHVKVGIFDYYISPGFGLLHHSLTRTEILLGPSLAYGLSAELDKTLALGLENTKLYSWIGDFKGGIADTFLAHVRFNL